MKLWQVMLEGHSSATTIYIAGLLTDLAAVHTEELVDLLGGDTRVVRLDLSAVEMIDPSAFVVVARALNRWRDRTYGRLTIEFPRRSARATKADLHLTVPPRIFEESAMV